MGLKDPKVLKETLPVPESRPKLGAGERQGEAGYNENQREPADLERLRGLGLWVDSPGKRRKDGRTSSSAETKTKRDLGMVMGGVVCLLLPWWPDLRGEHRLDMLSLCLVLSPDYGA